MFGTDAGWRLRQVTTDHLLRALPSQRAGVGRGAEAPGYGWRGSMWTGHCGHSSGLWTNDKAGRKRAGGGGEGGSKEGEGWAERYSAIVLDCPSSLPDQCCPARSQDGTRVRGSWTALSLLASLCSKCPGASGIWQGRSGCHLVHIRYNK